MLSIIIPTYNESQNILSLLDEIRVSLEEKTSVEMVVIDDNSPDGTGKLVEEYAARFTTNKYAVHTTNEIKSTFKRYSFNENNAIRNEGCLIKVIHRPRKLGLISAILQGVSASKGHYILVIDADFSHSPKLIPKM